MMKDLQDKILKLKKEKDIGILAHSYQAPEILEIADETGDSFQLSVAASKLPQATVIMCGVRFMADTVKILSPDKKVILSHPQATCPMAEQIAPEQVVAYRAQHPDHKIVAYINTTTQLKAVCDVCVTSSSALQIVSRLDAQNILFIPDRNLGSYIKSQIKDKNIILWDGMCPVHASVSVQDCEEMKKAYPNAKVLMHPELPPEILRYADYIGSTSGIIHYALECGEDCIIGTEKSIVDYLRIQRPDKRFYLLSKQLMCANMRLTTLMDVYQCLTGEGGAEIVLDEALRLRAKHPIDEMIRLGQVPSGK